MDVICNSTHDRQRRCSRRDPRDYQLRTNKWSEGPGVVAPVVAALRERVTPDLLALEARWASLTAYGVTAALLADVLPIDKAVNASTIRNDAMRVAERLEAELGA